MQVNWFADGDVRVAGKAAGASGKMRRPITANRRQRASLRKNN